MDQTQPVAGDTGNARPTIAVAAGMIVAIIVGVFVYATLCALLGIVLMHGGFLFLFYWAGMRLAARAEFAPSLVGALGGTLMAYLVTALPPQYGAAGWVVVGICLLGAIFMMIRGHLPLIINNAFMLYLTVFTLPGAVAPMDFVQVGGSLLLAAAFAFALMLGATWGAARMQKPAPAQTA